MSYIIKNMYTETTWTDNGPVYSYDFEFAFSTKEEYLEETKVWKREYKELSASIRECKRNRKQDRRQELGLSLWEVQMKLDSLKHDARIMNAMRVQAKAEAGRQMQAQAKAA